MNRPKFRVWDIEEQKWYKPTYKAYMKELHDIHIDLDGSLLIRTIDDSGKNVTIHESMFEGRYELLQSTGLKDINCTEIYDGDILQVSRNHTKTDERYFNDEKINYVIEFIIYDDMEAYADIEHYGWCAVSETNTSRCTLIDAVTLWRGTVVGNIYEHPHLLEENVE